MSHEKGIEAAGAELERQVRELARMVHAGDGTGEFAFDARSIIDAYLAEAPEVCGACGDALDRLLPSAQPTSEGEEREAFEEWARGEGYYVFNDPIGDKVPIYYTEENVRCMWKAWQARSAREGRKR